ncbi:MAG: DUF523 domain-containing protein, partial [Clostridiales bacterium]|nr:DUF523 domain-containing protein [Clostridiales bacterium]
MNLLISACLMGIKCRYDGKQKKIPELDRLMESYVLIPVCPEVLGGLPTPRLPSERRGEAVVTRDGRDVTENYRQGARESLRICQMTHTDCALLKERSPSCGFGSIYDGTFTGTLCPGDGVCAALLKQHGVRVYG